MPKGCESCGRPIRYSHADGCTRVHPRHKANIEVPVAEAEAQLEEYRHPMATWQPVSNQLPN